MTPQINIDDELFEMLKDNAEPLVDTPSSVLRRLLGIHSNGAAPEPDGDDPPGLQLPPNPRRVVRATHTRARKRASGEDLLPAVEYELPMLRYIEQEGGRAPSREVIEAVGEELKDRLTPVDREELRTGDVRWKSRIAFTRLRLVESGDLDGNAPRGTWAITDQGRQRLNDANSNGG